MRFDHHRQWQMAVKMYGFAMTVSDTYIPIWLTEHLMNAIPSACGIMEIQTNTIATVWKFRSPCSVFSLCGGWKFNCRCFDAFHIIINWHKKWYSMHLMRFILNSISFQFDKADHHFGWRHLQQRVSLIK